MPAREAMLGSGLDLPDGCDTTRGEIKALLESPELRRIFDDEPPGAGLRGPRGRRALRVNGRPAAVGRSDGPAARSPESAGSRVSRKRRILVGLAPLYLGVLILFFETVREPSMFLEVFGTPSVAEEPATRAGTAVIAAAGVGSAVQQSVEPPRNSALPAFEATGSLAGDTLARAGSTGAKTAEADVPQAIASEKAAIDLAKRASYPIGEAEAVSEASPAEAAEAPVVLATDARPLPGSAYPDPRAGPAAVAEPIDPAAAEAAEAALGLSRADRREVQRRLRFAASDPQMVDGIFGPATRAAIAAWQERSGLPGSGFLDETAMALLVEETADEYRAWRVAERARAREREAQSAVVASSAPPLPLPDSRRGECRRTASGEIAFGRDVGCNVRAFGANFKRDLRDLKGNIRQLFD